MTKSFIPIPCGRKIDPEHPQFIHDLFEIRCLLRTDWKGVAEVIGYKVSTLKQWIGKRRTPESLPMSVISEALHCARMAEADRLAGLLLKRHFGGGNQ